MVTGVNIAVQPVIRRGKLNRNEIRYYNAGVVYRGLDLLINNGGRLWRSIPLNQ